MIIDESVLSYLKGVRLSNGSKFSVPRSPLRTRNAALVDLARDQRVIHLGCADHPELIKRKRATGTYLHDLLSASAKSVIGLDTNHEALSQMRALGIKDLWQVDEYEVSDTCDLLLVPDVIEHVPNVGEFLASLRKFRATKIVITTPNAYRLVNRGQYRTELVNTDHRYWFSPYTLCKSLYTEGYIIDELQYTDSISWRRPIDSIKKSLFPLCRDGLLVVLR